MMLRAARSTMPSPLIPNAHWLRTVIMRSHSGGADAWWRIQTKFFKPVVMTANSERPKRIAQIDHASLCESPGCGFFAREVRSALHQKTLTCHSGFHFSDCVETRGW